MSSKVTTWLWYVDEAETAARFYVSLIPGSSMGEVSRAPADYPGGRAGDVLTVEFDLAGQAFGGVNGGEAVQYTHAMSIAVACEDQAEIDRLWSALTADGGAEIQCGWLKDRWGVQWQITPRVLGEMIAAPDRAAARRAMEAMLGMVKLDVAALQAAFRG